MSGRNRFVEQVFSCSNFNNVLLSNLSNLQFFVLHWLLGNSSARCGHAYMSVRECVGVCMSVTVATEIVTLKPFFMPQISLLSALIILMNKFASVTVGIV